MALKFDYDYCLICYNLLEETNVLKTKACDHVFCELCAFEIIKLNKLKTFKCPVDNKENQQMLLFHQNHIEYELLDFNDIGALITPEFVECLGDYVSQTNDFIKLIKKNIDAFKLMISNQIEIKLNLTNFLSGDGYYEDPLDKIDICSYFSTNESFIKKSILNKSLPYFKYMLNVFRLNYQYVKKCNNHLVLVLENMSHHDAIMNFDQQVKHVEHQFHSMENVVPFLMSVVISNFENTKNVYLKLNPCMDQQFDFKCLVCTNNLTGLNLVSFFGCSHKICGNCMDEYVINQAKCPIDGGEQLPRNNKESSETRNDLETHSSKYLSKIARVVENMKILKTNLIFVKNLFDEITVNSEDSNKIYDLTQVAITSMKFCDYSFSLDLDNYTRSKKLNNRVKHNEQLGYYDLENLNETNVQLTKIMRHVELFIMSFSSNIFNKENLSQNKWHCKGAFDYFFEKLNLELRSCELGVYNFEEYQYSKIELWFFVLKEDLTKLILTLSQK